MEARRHTDESVTLRSSLLITFMPKKILMIGALKKNKGSKASSSKKLSYGKKEMNDP